MVKQGPPLFPRAFSGRIRKGLILGQKGLVRAGRANLQLNLCFLQLFGRGSFLPGEASSVILKVKNDQ
jgi:hypothetical protein